MHILKTKKKGIKNDEFDSSCNYWEGYFCKKVIDALAVDYDRP